jgi:hypothetical protein
MKTSVQQLFAKAESLREHMRTFAQSVRAA